MRNLNEYAWFEELVMFPKPIKIAKGVFVCAKS